MKQKRNGADFKLPKNQTSNFPWFEPRKGQSEMLKAIFPNKGCFLSTLNRH